MKHADHQSLALEVAPLAALKVRVQVMPREIAPGIEVTGDGFALGGGLVRNLVDNAIRYTPASGEITVRLIKDGQRAVLHVARCDLSLFGNPPHGLLVTVSIKPA